MKDNEKLCFSYDKNGKLWITLIEKALAKLNEIFERIEHKKPHVNARDLTGAPSYEYIIGDHANLFELLIEAKSKGYIITANCGSKNIPEKFAAPNRVSTKNKNNVEVMATGLAFKNAKNKKLRVLLSLKKLRTLTCERILGT